jgi:hypothetical protein
VRGKLVSSDLVPLPFFFAGRQHFAGDRFQVRPSTRKLSINDAMRNPERLELYGVSARPTIAPYLGERIIASAHLVQIGNVKSASVRRIGLRMILD